MSFNIGKAFFNKPLNNSIMIKQETKTIILPAGSKFIGVPFDIKTKGIVKRAVIFTTGDPSEEASISIDYGGRNIIPPTNFRDWQDGQGNYMERKKPMDFEGGREYKVYVNSEENQATDFQFELLLLIEEQAQN